MRIRYKSLGAAKTVTGSRHFFEIGDFNVLLDCGLFQGLKENRLRNWEGFPIEPSTINAVIISHAHIDHSGYLPRLVKEGFTGQIYCTKATEALLQIMLEDSAKLQEEEAEWAHKKGYSRHANPLPLYTIKDAKRVFPLIHAVDFDTRILLDPKISLQFKIAGHILGAAIVELNISGLNQEKKIIFSGDLGRQSDPLLFPPDIVEKADILLIESTYGDRENIIPNVEDTFAEIINETNERGGCTLIPAFSVGRTQNILYYLKNMMESKKIPFMPVYIDSPMAISVTDLYRSFSHLQKLQSKDLEERISIFDYAHFHYVKNQLESSALNDKKNKTIIISASGMCTGGRILHHLFHRLPNKQDTLALVGYQAEGSRGRRLQNGEKSIPIFGLQIEVNCKVEVIHGLSAHADNSELLAWMHNIKESPKMTFVIHGETTAAYHMAGQIKGIFDWNVAVPDYLESFELFNGI